MSVCFILLRRKCLSRMLLSFHLPRDCMERRRRKRNFVFLHPGNLVREFVFANLLWQWQIQAQNVSEGSRLEEIQQLFILWLFIVTRTEIYSVKRNRVRDYVRLSSLSALLSNRITADKQKSQLENKNAPCSVSHRIVVFLIVRFIAMQNLWIGTELCVCADKSSLSIRGEKKPFCQWMRVYTLPVVLSVVRNTTVRRTKRKQS